MRTLAHQILAFAISLKQNRTKVRKVPPFLKSINKVSFKSLEFKHPGMAKSLDIGFHIDDASINVEWKIYLRKSWYLWSGRV